MKIDTARRRLRGNLKPNRFGISCEDERDRKDVGKYHTLFNIMEG